MNPNFPKVAVFAGTAVLAGGVAVGVASKGGATADQQGGAMVRPGGAPGVPDGTQPGGGRAGAPGLATLAEQLGVSGDELQAALDDVRDSGAAPDSLAAALARELGIPEAKVAAALEAVLPRGGMGGPPPDGSGTTPPDGGTTSPGSGTVTT